MAVVVTEWTIDLAQMENLDAWMDLVRRVLREFPGLETGEVLAAHQAIVSKNIMRRTALCAKGVDRIIGVLLFSKDRNTLSFLAVDPEYRQRGIASALVKQMLEEFSPESDIWVTTFRANDPKGDAPRALYQKLGFTEGELVEEFDYPCQMFVLRGH